MESSSFPEPIHIDTTRAQTTVLKEVARLRLRSLPVDRTLEASALLEELVIHLCSGIHQVVQTRVQLQAEAAAALRRALVEYVKAPDTQKRAGSCRVRLAEAKMTQPCQLHQIAELDKLLEKLAGQDARMASVVELRYFGGMSHSEIAEALGIGEGTVKRDWRLARAWLYTQLHGSRLHAEGTGAG